MSRFRKKPVVIEAKRYDGSFQCSIGLMAWAHEGMPPDANRLIFHAPGECLSIRTLEGMMIAAPGDWIIRGIKGELYPCKPDIFEATYEPAPDSEEPSHG